MFLLAVGIAAEAAELKVLSVLGLSERVFKNMSDERGDGP